MSVQDSILRRNAAMHAMQSGVATEMEYRPEPTNPKHLRVGVNAAMSDQAGLVKLLVDKGVITDEEYAAAVADAMEQEKLRYEAHLSTMLGTKITLL